MTGLTRCMPLVPDHDFHVFVDILQNFRFQKKHFSNPIRVSNSLDPGQARLLVGPDLGSKCKDYQPTRKVAASASSQRGMSL